MVTLTRLVLSTLGLASLAACSRGDRVFHVDQHPMLSGPVIDSILPALQRASAPGSSNTWAAPVNAAGSSDEPIKGVLEANGEEWLFRGKIPSEALRVHLIYEPFNGTDTNFRVHVEIRQPYARDVDGHRVMVTQAFADERIQKAFGEMVDQMNADSWRQIRADPQSPGQPVVAALRQLAPSFATVPSAS